jgi:hypothetical protein
MAGRLFTYCKELVGVYHDLTESDTETDTDSSANSIRSTDSPDATVAADVKPDVSKITTTAYAQDDINALASLAKQVCLDIASGIERNSADVATAEAWYLAEKARLVVETVRSGAEKERLDAEIALSKAETAWFEAELAKAKTKNAEAKAKAAHSPETKVADSPEAKVADSSDTKAVTDVKPDDNDTATTAASNEDAMAKLVSLAIASGIEPNTAHKAAADAWYLAEKAGLNAEKGWLVRLEAKVADSSEAKVAVSPDAKAADSPDAKAVTEVKPEDNGTASTAASKEDAKVEQVNLDIASGSQQEGTTQADIEAGQVAELARLEAKLATSDAKLIGLAADLARADCLIFKKEQEHLRLHDKLSSLHEAYSKRYEELTKQNQELERVVEESQPGTAADMALLLLYLSRAAVDIAGTAKLDAEKFLRRADQQWEAYKQGYPLDDEGDASDAEGAESASRRAVRRTLERANSPLSISALRRAEGFD